jgi:hypothetical protein
MKKLLGLACPSYSLSGLLPLASASISGPVQPLLERVQGWQAKPELTILRRRL